MKGEIYNKHIGEVHERLTIKQVVRDPRPRFVCDCECGGSKTIDVFSVLHGKTTSCGCYRKEKSALLGKSNRKPGVRIGEVFYNKKQLAFQVIKYEKSTKVLVRFIDSGFEAWAAVKEIKRGAIRDWIATPLVPKDKKYYYPRENKGRKSVVEVGQLFETKYGETVEVVSCKSAKCIIAKFTDVPDYQFQTTITSLRKGTSKHPYRRTIHGVGCLGVGNYKVEEHEVARNRFSNMIGRCFLESELKKAPRYRECSIVEDWLNFQKFAEWYYTQTGAGDKDYHLDKDILVKGCKVYSPETCCLVPQEINKLFTKREAKRGEYPIGVSEFSEGVYRASMSNKIISDRSWQGPLRSTVEQAFQDYKHKKEATIKEVAELYKDRVDSKVYQALINYEVEITD